MLRSSKLFFLNKPNLFTVCVVVAEVVSESAAVAAVVSQYFVSKLDLLRTFPNRYPSTSLLQKI